MTKVADIAFSRVKVVTVFGVFLALLVQYCNVSNPVLPFVSIEVLIYVPLVFIVGVFQPKMFENVDLHVLGGNHQFLLSVCL